MSEATKRGPAPTFDPKRLRFVGLLGPGLITGASDDDPSGIATYSQAGAQFGFAISWTMLFSYPLMVAIQQISARIGRITGKGIAGNLRQHYPNWLLQSIVALLFLANTINIGADLGAMADALRLLIGGSALMYVVLFGCICAVVQVFMSYRRYVTVLKWLTLALFAYFGTVLTVQIPWGEAVLGLLVPTFLPDASFWTTVVALLGTTISPYLFFWQAAQEAEDTRVRPERKPLVRAPGQGPAEIERIRLDTYVGMAFSNLVALAIIVATAATLHAAGITDVQTSSQAAEALRPVAGPFAFILFASELSGPACSRFRSWRSPLPMPSAKPESGPSASAANRKRPRNSMPPLRSPLCSASRSTFRPSIRSKRCTGVPSSMELSQCRSWSP